MILIKNVLLGKKRVNLLIDGRYIESIGKKAKDKSDVVIDGRTKACLPGFVNAHTHAAMTLLRGYADDLPLKEWLEKHIWPVEARLKEKHVYWGTRLACIEMIKSGTTCFNDMYFFPKATASAVMDAGLRAVISAVMLDALTGSKSAEQLAQEIMKICKRSELLKPALAPHAIYTVSKENLVDAATVATEHQLLVHTHISETAWEVKYSVKRYGKRPVSFLKSIGFLNPRVIAAHGVWLSAQEVKTLANHGCTIVHCPISNMKLACGNVFPYEKAKEVGLNVCLGTDGCSSNNNLDMMEEMKMASLLQKHNTVDPTILKAGNVLTLATENGAKALRIEAGQIKEGMLADLILIDVEHHRFSPGFNLTSDVVYAASSESVTHTICNGKLLMDERKIEGEEKVVRKACSLAHALVRS
jgi:5-methylthioadenosine/S-adenosylhomocysteine deaminase